MKKISILVVDDERDVREPLSQYLRAQGYLVETAVDGLDALNKIKIEHRDIVLTDLKMPIMDGFELLEKVKKTYPSIYVIVFTSSTDVNVAVRSIKTGAHDYVIKPVIFEDINNKIIRIKKNIESPLRTNKISSDFSIDSIIGDSQAVKDLKNLILQISNSGTNALIQGENGTGKELVAKALHYESSRKKMPFVAINCAAIPSELLESEFFGYLKGSFTGANTDKVGHFVAANNGTLFLDEIGDLPLSMQVKLLRAIELQEVLPIGANKPIKVNFTLIAATAKNLAEEVQNNNFREDLYYRINIIEIDVIALRDRIEDIPLLADYFLFKICKTQDKNIKSISAPVYEALKKHLWSGNIRELRNVIERAIVLCSGDEILLKDLPRYIESLVSEQESKIAYKAAIQSFEKEFILKTLKSCNYDKKLTAKVLSIGLSSLYRKLEELGIESS